MCLFFSAVIAIIGLIVLAVIFGVGLCLWIGLSVGVVFGCRPKGKRWPWLLASVSLYVLVFSLLATAAAWAMWPDDASRFEYAFDAPPGPTVVIHEIEIDGLCDWEDIEVFFSAKPPDIQRITARGLTLDTAYDPSGTGVASTPFGQIALTGKDTYTGGSPNQRYNTVDDATSIYDPATEEAWYWYSGLD